MLKHSKKIMNVLIAVDASGSMSATKTATINAINDLIKSYEEKDLRAELEVIFFDSQITEHQKLSPLSGFKKLDNFNYRPTGGTALYDAFGSLISRNKDSGRDTVLVLLTDGYENSSREFNQSQVATMIKDVQNRLEWEVVFLGANITDFQQFTTSLNIKGMNSYNFADTSIGRSDAVMFASASLNSFGTTRGYMSTTVVVDESPFIDVQPTAVTDK